MKIGIVGCGYAVDFYIANLNNHPTIKVVAVYDLNSERAQILSKKYGYKIYHTLDEILNDDEIQLILNTTNPKSHYKISSAALLNGRHVYSEKPIALTSSDAKSLLDIAKNKGVRIGSAPCSVYGDAGSTILELIKRKKIGRPVLVRAEISEGMIHKMNHSEWISDSGFVWPADDEFDVGCTLEHGAYILSWLIIFFGKVKEVTGYAKTIIPLKGNVIRNGDDWSASIVKFHSGVIAEMHLSILSPTNHHMTIIGDDGIITIEDLWNNRSNIYIQKYVKPKVGSPHEYLSKKKKINLPKDNRSSKYIDTHDMDQVLGIAKFCEAIKNGESSYIDGELAAHTLDVLIAIKQSGGNKIIFD